MHIYICMILRHLIFRGTKWDLHFGNNSNRAWCNHMMSLGLAQANGHLKRYPKRFRVKRFSVQGLGSLGLEV